VIALQVLIHEWSLVDLSSRVLWLDSSTWKVYEWTSDIGNPSRGN